MAETRYYCGGQCESCGSGFSVSSSAPIANYSFLCDRCERLVYMQQRGRRRVR